MSALWKLTPFYRPVAGWVLAGAGLAGVTLAAGIGILGVSGWFIASMGIAGLAGVSMNYFTPGAIIRGLAIIRTGGRYAERLVTHDAALRVTAELRGAVFRRLALGRGTKVHSGTLFSVLRGDTETLEKFYLHAVVPICASALVMPGVLAAAWVAAPVAAMILLGGFTVAGIVVPLAAYGFSRTAQKNIDAQVEALRRMAADYTGSMTELVIYDAANAMAGRIDAQSVSLAQSQKRLQRIEALAAGAGFVAMQATMLGVVAVCAGLVQAGTLHPAYFVMLPLLVMAGFDAVSILPPALQAIAAARPAAARVFGENDARDWPQNVESGPAVNADCRNIGFAYPGGEAVLRDVNFMLPPGTSAVLTGVSGAGKSTLVRLVTGVEQPDTGRVYLDGVDASTMDEAARMALFSVAAQRPFFFSGSMRDNLLRARPDADEDALQAACALAGLAPDIAAMPAGLDTDVGERGAALSGGQGRRLALAQAWIKPAGIIILDEPSEGLDDAQAVAVLSRLADRASEAGRSLLVVTHNRAVISLFGTRVSL